MAGVLLGATDADLRAQSIPAATFPVATVFSSPLRRALHTAQLLFPDQQPVILTELAERNYGFWEGLTWDEVERSWPELAGRALVDWLGTTPPGGEPWSRVVERAVSALHRIRQAEVPIAVVAHAGINAALAQLVAGRKPTEFRQAYLEVFTFELES